ncbi:hypothetical protein JW897_08020 [Chromobacterium alkanivorans]|uniref:hypothetical protein n=1 Tax=Chromobacterium alkanivorans TaxID=1071719 RepID=UPI00196755B7|nr:hypothetical protein [Chromobacterium alkanivorans]MBN3003681.1 hypothetical protein [Chromobacterium alkanivorans]
MRGLLLWLGLCAGVGAMGLSPWEEGTLVAVGAPPLVRLGVEKGDGGTFVIQPAADGRGLGAAEVAALKKRTGSRIRYRAGPFKTHPLLGREAVLLQAEVLEPR